jgi:hypothetical protein
VNFEVVDPVQRPEGRRPPREAEGRSRTDRRPVARQSEVEAVEQVVREPKVPRPVPEVPRSVYSHHHFSRPPLGSSGIKKHREIPALLGGLLKKTP